VLLELFGSSSWWWEEAKSQIISLRQLYDNYSSPCAIVNGKRIATTHYHAFAATVHIKIAKFFLSAHLQLHPNRSLLEDARSSLRQAIASLFSGGFPLKDIQQLHTFMESIDDTKNQTREAAIKDFLG